MVVLDWGIVLSAGIGTVIGIGVVLLLVKVIGPLLLVAAILTIDLIEDLIDRIRDPRKQADRDMQ